MKTAYLKLYLTLSMLALLPGMSASASTVDPWTCHRTLELTASPKAALKGLNSLTYRPVRISGGKHGGTSITIVKQPLVLRGPVYIWDRFIINSQDSPGNIKFPIWTLGEAASYFGFSQKGPFWSRKFTIPDLFELNNAIDRYNEGLDPGDPKRILVHFYPEDGRTSVRDFLLNFSTHLMLPIGLKGKLRYHDLNFHTSILIMPNDHLKYAAQLAGLPLQFEAFTQSKGWSSRPIVKTFLKRWIHIASVRLDVGTARMAQLFEPIPTLLAMGAAIEMYGHLNTINSTIYGSVKSPADNVREFFSSLKEELRKQFGDDQIQFLDQAVVKFIESKTAQSEGFSERPKSYTDGSPTDFLSSQLYKRRKIIAERVRQLDGNP